MLYYDVSSERYFLKDESILEEQLNKLIMESSHGNLITWNEYYRTLGLPIIQGRDIPISCVGYGMIDFEIYKGLDCTYIIVCG